MASEPPLGRNESDWLMPVSSPDAEAIELPAPDEKAFATEYRPWRTVILGDGSEAATHPAPDAVGRYAGTSTRPMAQRPLRRRRIKRRA
jgi:hypothetical protein